MRKPSRILLVGMAIVFGVCCLGLVGGMFYTLAVYFIAGRALEQSLGNSIFFYKFLGALGVLGFILFFLFLASLAIGPKNRR